MKKYWQFSNEWRLVGLERGFFGPAIISEDTLYLVPRGEGDAARKSGASVAAGAVGGAVGGAIGGLIAAAGTSKADTVGLNAEVADEMALADLPNEVLSHRQWPIKRPKNERVLLIDRKNVKGWKFPWWSGLSIFLPDDSEIFFSPSFRQWTVRKYFRDFGYPRAETSSNQIDNKAE